MQSWKATHVSPDHLGAWGARTVGKQEKERSAGKPNKPRGELNIGKDLRQKHQAAACNRKAKEAGSENYFYRDEIPGQSVEMRECPHSAKTQEVFENPSSPPSRFPSDFALWKSLGCQVSGMDSPILQEFWRSMDKIL